MFSQQCDGGYNRPREGGLSRGGPDKRTLFSVGCEEGEGLGPQGLVREDSRDMSEIPEYTVQRNRNVGIKWKRILHSRRCGDRREDLI